MTQKIHCPLITNGLEIRPNGTYSSCCITSKQFADENGGLYNVQYDSVKKVWESEDRKKFIENFDTEFHTHCKACKEIEASGGASKRINEIKNFGEQSDNTTDIYYLDLKMGNTCNLACAICGPFASSKWASLYKKFNIELPYKVEQWQEQDAFWDQLPEIAHYLQRIELSGGEPFMIKKQEKLIKYLIENDLAKNIDILWITNCTIWPEQLVNYFKHFKLVRIMLSLDNTGEQFEYIRYPGKWDDTYKIFLKWKELEDQGLINLGISHSIGMLNAWHLADFHQWCRDHKVFVYNNIVYNPMSAKDLPMELKLQIKEKLDATADTSYQVNPIAGPDNWFTKFMMQEGDVERSKKHHDTYVMITRSREHFEQALPELSKFI